MGISSGLRSSPGKLPWTGKGWVQKNSVGLSLLRRHRVGNAKRIEKDGISILFFFFFFKSSTQQVFPSFLLSSVNWWGILERVGKNAPRSLPVGKSDSYPYIDQSLARLATLKGSIFLLKIFILNLSWKESKFTFIFKLNVCYVI